MKNLAAVPETSTPWEAEAFTDEFASEMVAAEPETTTASLPVNTTPVRVPVINDPAPDATSADCAAVVVLLAMSVSVSWMLAAEPDATTALPTVSETVELVRMILDAAPWASTPVPVVPAIEVVEMVA
jgi:hypothetical protein